MIENNLSSAVKINRVLYDFDNDSSDELSYWRNHLLLLLWHTIVSLLWLVCRIIDIFMTENDLDDVVAVYMETQKTPDMRYQDFIKEASNPRLNYTRQN